MIELTAFNLHVPAGFRFCVLRQREGGASSRGTIIHVHAFAEEMNKSRHMVALAADAWARDGWCVLQIDLGGCGDSAGEFGDATWDGWLEDVRLACEWGRARNGGPLWLWGLRLGALLACEADRRFHLDCGLLLWQPVTGGKQHFQQFLRLWQGGQIVGKTMGDADTSPRQRLAAGAPVEVAGYEISPELAKGIEMAQIDEHLPSRRVHCFQVNAATSAAPSPALERVVAKWRERGVDVRVHATIGPSFWQAQEIEIADDLLLQSSRVMNMEQEAERLP